MCIDASLTVVDVGLQTQTHRRFREEETAGAALICRSVLNKLATFDSKLNFSRRRTALYRELSRVPKGLTALQQGRRRILVGLTNRHFMRSEAERELTCLGMMDTAPSQPSSRSLFRAAVLLISVVRRGGFAVTRSVTFIYLNPSGHSDSGLESGLILMW